MGPCHSMLTTRRRNGSSTSSMMPSEPIMSLPRSVVEILEPTSICDTRVIHLLDGTPPSPTVSPPTARPLGWGYDGRGNHRGGRRPESEMSSSPRQSVTGPASTESRFPSGDESTPIARSSDRICVRHSRYQNSNGATWPIRVEGAGACAELDEARIFRHVAAGGSMDSGK